MRLIIQVSHGADPYDWFVVRPMRGRESRSMAGTVITNEAAVQSLRDAGRTVIELEVEPYEGLRGETNGRHRKAAAQDHSRTDT